MGANEALGLPRDRMKKITIAFDVDGTLRCNCTDTCMDINERTYDLLVLLDRLKNTKIYVWSGGGPVYAESFFDSKMSKQYLRGHKVKRPQFLGKIGGFRPDIAIDDIQDTALGTINLIVREK